MEGKRLSSFSTSATVVLSNDYLLIQVLFFLPAKSLLRFKSLNKQWNSIISGEHFGRLHTVYHRLRPKPFPHFILRSMKQFHLFSPVSKTLFRYHFNFPHTCILQSCHGLLLLECRSKQFGRKDYYVCNPTTTQCRKLSLNCDGNSKKTTIAGISLVFDPSKSPDYKVVCIWKIPSMSQYRVEVYGSGRDPNTVGEPFIASHSATFSKGIYWNDGIYWIRPRWISFVLDVNTVTFGKPPKIKIRWKRKGQRSKNYVMESNGHIHRVALYSRRDEILLLVFEMNGTKSGWCEKYYANLKLFDYLCSEMCGLEQVNVLGIIRGEREEDSAVLLHVPAKIICYRFCDGSSEVVVDLSIYIDFFRNSREDGLIFQRGDAYQFTETLAPV